MTGSPSKKRSIKDQQNGSVSKGTCGQPDDLRLTPETHMMEGENGILQEII